MQLLVFYSLKNLLRHKNRYMVTGILFFFAICIGSYLFITARSCTRSIEAIKNSLQNRHTLSYTYLTLDTKLPILSKDIMLKYMSLPSADKVILTYIRTIYLSDVYKTTPESFYKELYGEMYEKGVFISNSVYPNSFILEGFNSLVLDDIDEFKFGINVLTEGRMFEKNNEVIISDELANHNNLKLGSKLYSDDTIPGELQSFELTVVGIYSVKNDIYDLSSRGLPVRKIMPDEIDNNINNIIYTNLDTAYGINGKYDDSEDHVHTVSPEFFKYYAIIYANPNSLNALNDELYSNGFIQEVEVAFDSSTFSGLIRKLDNLSVILYTTWIILLPISIIILVVILFINLKMRRTEYAVLCTMGMSKLKLLLYLSCEMLFFIFVIFLTSTAIARLFAGPLFRLFYPANINNWFNVSIAFDIYYARDYLLLLLVAALIVIMFFMVYFVRFSLRKLIISQN